MCRVQLVITKKIVYVGLDLRIIAFFKRTPVPVTRVSIFLVFFWFGIIKVLGLSPASPLAEALTAKTVGMRCFDELFIGLAVIKYIIGVLFFVS